MSYDPTLALYVDNGLNPPEYWVVVSSDFTGADDFYIENGNGNIPANPDSEGVFHLDVNVSTTPSPQSYPVIHNIDLGTIALNEPDAELTIHIMGPSGQLGTTTIAGEDAEQESRPWN